ncbi:MAG: outer membrane protein assembly factor BamD [Bacteroidota bacterium]|mgnify:FL=1|nr:outer membrane protein assembly factor BamD [Bacteroidota bacterium]MDX5426625.1 outer membrane protein assembly factor BamD [Bacteroidota bacterium]MDX5504634.1 outer membrane protein assembly factor BamD [Bacteroidota bacterium]
MILKKVRGLVLLLGALIILSSCGEYQKVLKSSDLEYKFQAAKKYYEQQKYEKAYPIFDELLTLYRGTLKAEEVYFYYASTLYGMHDYYLAAYHYKTFYETFPSSQWAEEAAYQSAYCYYLESPTYSLDQANTYKAMNEFQLFINRYPRSEKIPICNDRLDELRAKLERKSFEIARQYYRTENYQAAVQAVENTLNDFPDTEYREEAMFIKLDAAFKLADNSILGKKEQRFKEAITAYYDFTALYPNSNMRKAADRIFEQTKQQLQQFNI